VHFLLLLLLLLLQSNQVSWKKLGPYNLKCRKVLQLQPYQATQLQQQQDGSSSEACAMDTSSTPTAASAAAANAAAAAVAAAAAAAGGPEAMQHDGPKQPPQQQQQQFSGLSVNIGNSSSSRPSSLHLHSSCFMGNSSSNNHTLGGAAVDGAAAVDYILKFETQMYKIRDDEYAIDVQVRQG
jgi:hypothetical protein